MKSLRCTMYGSLILLVNFLSVSFVQGQWCTAYTVGGTGQGQPCANSWIYQGITYRGCTTIDHPRAWCATTAVYNGAWGNCLDANSPSCTTACRTVTDGGTSTGAPCVFPFIYKGTTYNYCTTADHNKHWCATTSSFRGLWGNCRFSTDCAGYGVVPVTLGPRCTTRTEGGSANGAPCVIPFSYKGTIFNTCTDTDYGRPWCSTTAQYVGKWGLCPDIGTCGFFCPALTLGGTANTQPCVFPFVYKGSTYEACTTIDNQRHWCSTTTQYQGQWGECVYARTCPLSTPAPTGAPTRASNLGYCLERTSGGTANGAPCAPEWEYKGITYRTCVTFENPRPWCSTTARYSGSWGACDVGECTLCRSITTGGTGGGKPCVFPFVYKGVQYNACTTRDWRTHWCSTDAFYSNSFGECVYDDCPYCTARTTGGTGDGLPCAASWSYKGQIYRGCITLDHTRPWCSTTATFNTLWGNCLDANCPGLCRNATELGTAGGAPCVFPFSYQGTVYSSCTTKDHFRHWCSTTSVFQNQWGNCIYSCT